jgi:hypothetical protein
MASLEHSTYQNVTCPYIFKITGGAIIELVSDDYKAVQIDTHLAWRDNFVVL